MFLQRLTNIIRSGSFSKNYNVQLTPVVSIESNKSYESLLRDIYGGGFAQHDRNVPLAEHECLRHIVCLHDSDYLYTIYTRYQGY